MKANRIQKSRAESWRGGAVVVNTSESRHPKMPMPRTSIHNGNPKTSLEGFPQIHVNDNAEPTIETDAKFLLQVVSLTGGIVSF
mmetsp:Transcript_1125/g.7310  ORF Transcript_1125/g.7310 Transcript_1125/m.7310 type:complete len:84 (-) Transcript_1125:1031-1282(-)